MIADHRFGSYGPFTYWGRLPIYATSILVGVHVLTMVATSLLMAFGATSFLSSLMFFPSAVIQKFEMWRVVTYAFINTPSLWFAVEMILLYIFGREVEKTIGHKAFLALYGVLVLTIPLTFVVVSLFTMTFKIGDSFLAVGFAGSSAIHFAIFVGFCVLFPHAPFFFGMKAKWVALVLLGISSLQALAGQSWESLLALWATTASAFFMLHTKGLPIGAFFQWVSQRKVRSSFKMMPPPKGHAKRDPREEIDMLLDKISRKGIGSLTPQERDRLESAREELLKKEKPHRINK